MKLPDAAVKFSRDVYVRLLVLFNGLLAFSSSPCPVSRGIVRVGCLFGLPGSNETQMLAVGSNVYTFSTTLSNCGLHMIGLGVFYSGSCVVRLAVFNSTGSPHTPTGSASLLDRKFLPLPAKANGGAYLVNFSTPWLLLTGTSSRVDLTFEEAGLECLIMSTPVHGDQASCHPWQVTVYDRNEQHWKHQKYGGLLGVAAFVQDADECELEVHDCEANTAICVNTFYSFQCHCKMGYQKLNSSNSCVDIDECNSVSTCGDAGQMCNNTDGSFTCRCQQGYDLLNNSCHSGYNLTNGTSESKAIPVPVLGKATPAVATPLNAGYGGLSVSSLTLFVSMIVAYCVFPFLDLCYRG